MTLPSVLLTDVSNKSRVAGNLSVFCIRPQSTYVTVEDTYRSNPLPSSHMFHMISVLMQWAEGGRSVPILHHPAIAFRSLSVIK
jgi:hypothetical protein